MPIWGIPPLLMNCTFHYSIDCAHCDRTLGIQAAWPDDEIKVAQIDPIVAQIIPKAVFIKMFCFFKYGLRSYYTFGLVLLQKVSLRTFKNRPIWSHWIQGHFEQKSFVPSALTK